MATNSDFATCKCGCREHVSGKSIYRPGHDARHVSILLNVVKDDVKVGRSHLADYRRGLSMLPTDALKAKFTAAVQRLENKGGTERKVEAPALAVPEDGDHGQRFEDGDGNVAHVNRVTERADVKIGRWFYPARELHTDLGIETQRNTKRDGTGEWVLVD